jgi:hypothetical protein
MTKKAIVKKNFYYKGESNSMNVISKGTELKHKDGWYVIHNIAIEPTLFPENFIEDTPKYFEVITEYNRNWKPEEGESYWFEEANGDISYNSYLNHPEHHRIIQHLPVFPTREKLEEWKKARKTLYDLRDEINGDWVPNWENEEEKYYLAYGWKSEEVREYISFVIAQSNNLWFKESPKTYCQKNGINWDDIQEAFKIYLRVK